MDTFSPENRRHWIGRGYSLHVITALCGPGLNNASAFADSLIPAAPGDLVCRSSPRCRSSRLSDPLSSEILRDRRTSDPSMASANNRRGEGSYACRVQLPHSETREIWGNPNCANTLALQFAQGVDRRDTADNIACNEPLALALLPTYSRERQNVGALLEDNEVNVSELSADNYFEGGGHAILVGGAWPRVISNRTIVSWSTNCWKQAGFRIARDAINIHLTDPDGTFNCAEAFREPAT